MQRITDGVPMRAVKKAVKSIQSLTDLFLLLNNSQSADSEVNLYRGHPDGPHVLRPSLFREKKYRRVERNILRELIAIQPDEFRNDKTSFEQLVRMQHYGLPTRLLDLTYNPLVAVYFACGGAREGDGEFIKISLPTSSMKYFDSDAVSCVANLSHLTGRERDQIRSLRSAVALRRSNVGLRLLHFIKAEKPYFLPKIVLSDLNSVFAVRPKQTNRRTLAQQGAFLIFGLRTSLKDRNDLGIRIRRTRIPASSKPVLLAELDRININESSLFPEVESAAKYIMSKIPSAGETDEKSD